MNFKKYLQSLDIEPDTSIRTTCIICGGVNTLSITRRARGYVWHCYRATCSCKGGFDTELSYKDVESVLHEGQELLSQKIFKVPSYWMPATHSEVQKYIRDNNFEIAWKDGRVILMYDPKQNRYVFLSMNGGNCIGAFGRGINPKWWNYTPHVLTPFIVPQYGKAGFPVYTDKRVGIVVEDCASAAAASCMADGVALIGTTLKNAYFHTLHQYDKLTIALDKDASNKAIEFQKILTWYSDTKVVILDKDLKYLKSYEINNLFS